MTCPNLHGEYCGVVSDLCGLQRRTAASTCDACRRTNTPQGKNLVTCGLAILAIRESGKRVEDFPEVYQLLLSKVPTGPGDELKKLISWLYVPDDSSCKCNDRIAKMNKWGPDGCEERMDTIVRWLKHSAATHNIPFQETVVRMLIKRAISNARKAV